MYDYRPWGVGVIFSVIIEPSPADYQSTGGNAHHIIVLLFIYLKHMAQDKNCDTYKTFGCLCSLPQCRQPKAKM